MSINMGYYHQDGAEVYKTETELGTAIKQSGVAREKLFVTTKVLPNIADIPAALKTSLKKLQTDYVDLYENILSKSILWLIGVKVSDPCAILQRQERRASGKMEANGGAQIARSGQVHRRVELSA
jgi:predicted aldo/keto reductase-like oxidoreductase